MPQSPILILRAPIVLNLGLPGLALRNDVVQVAFTGLSKPYNRNPETKIATRSMLSCRVLTNYIFGACCLKRSIGLFDSRFVGLGV